MYKNSAQHPPAPSKKTQKKQTKKTHKKHHLYLNIYIYIRTMILYKGPAPVAIFTCGH